MSEPSQLPPYKKVGRIVATLIISANALGALLTFVFRSFIAPLPDGENVTDVSANQNLLATVIGTVILMALGSALGGFGRKHFPHWYERLRAGESYKGLPDAARREVLNYPLVVAMTSLAMWLAASLLFGLWAEHSIRPFLSIALVGGVFTSTLTFFTDLVRRGWYRSFS
jgi:hypothetical protein